MKTKKKQEKTTKKLPTRPEKETVSFSVGRSDRPMTDDDYDNDDDDGYDDDGDGNDDKE